MARIVSWLNQLTYFVRPNAAARPATLVKNAAIALSYCVIIVNPQGWCGGHYASVWAAASMPMHDIDNSTTNLQSDQVVHLVFLEGNYVTSLQDDFPSIPL